MMDNDNLLGSNVENSVANGEILLVVKLERNTIVGLLNIQEG